METTWVYTVLGLLWWWFIWTGFVIIFYLDDNPDVSVKLLLDIAKRGAWVAFVAYAALVLLLTVSEMVDFLESFLFG